MTTVSVVMCSIEPAKLAKARASYERAFAEIEHEIIAIRDARSLAEAYDRAIDAARGDALVFSHDDVEILSPDFAARLLGHLASYDIVGIAGTTRLIGGAWHLSGHPFDYMLVVAPHPESGKLVMLISGGSPLVVAGAALDGVFIAARAAVARSLRFDEATFDHFHLYDLDFTFRASLAGHRVAVCRDLVLIHHSQGRYDPKWDEQRRRFERKFAGRLARPLPRRQLPVLNFPVGDAIVADPGELARFTRADTLAGFVARIDAMALRLGPSTNSETKPS